MVNSLKDLQKEILRCNLCKDRFNKLGFEPNPIVWGNENAKIIQISQAPSYNVYKTGKPFNDLSGKKIRQWYNISEEIFYNKDNFYITSIAHCFPGKSKAGDIKPPLICAKIWLNKELPLINNKLYVIIGRFAANFFFPKNDYSDLIFNNQKLNKKLTLVIPHPSPLNQRWFKEHPDFETKRLSVIRKIIHNTLNNEK